MFKLDLPVDRREAAALQARRQREEERKTRIFDSKQRTMGFDYDMLKRQADERRARDEEERKLQAAADAEMVRQDKLIQVLEARQRAEIKSLAKANLDFQMTSQQRTSRREYDLNDPHAVKNASPIRAGDDDPRLGVSSLQKFAGEDLAHDVRQKLQQQQMRQWNQQQLDLKQKDKDEEEALARLEDIRLKSQLHHVSEIQEAESTARFQMTHASLEANLALATEKAMRMRQQQAQEEQLKLNELIANVNSDFLSENPLAATPNGSTKILMDRFKGYTPAQLDAIRREQAAQAGLLQTQRLESKQLKEAQDRQLALYDRTAVLLERKTERARKELARLQAETNFHMAEEKKLQTHMATTKLTQPPTDAYYAQFNTTSR